MKKQKGMTLMEIIVSCAIYAMFALLIAETMTLVNSTMRATNQLNRRLSFEGRNADNMVTTDLSAIRNSETRHVNYQIRYDGSWSGSSWTGPTKYVAVNPNASASSYSVYDSANARNNKDGLEYVANYDDSAVVGTRYNQNVNYRFMTFDKVVLTPEGWPGNVFEVNIQLVPYFTSDDSTLTDAEKQNAIAKANQNLSKMETMDITDVQNAPLMAGEDTHIGPPAGSHGYALGATYTVRVENICEVIPDGTQNMPAEIKFNVKGEKVGSSSSDIDNWTDFRCTYYQYVNVGTSRSNESYYNRVIIEYNVAERKFKVVDSIRSDAPPTLPVYPT